jgi:hypothetical protein
VDTGLRYKVTVAGVEVTHAIYHRTRRLPLKAFASGLLRHVTGLDVLRFDILQHMLFYIRTT